MIQSTEPLILQGGHCRAIAREPPKNEHSSVVIVLVVVLVLEIGLENRGRRG